MSQQQLLYGCFIILLHSIYRFITKSRRYKIVECISQSKQLQEVVEVYNKYKYKIPSKQYKIRPEKLEYVRQKFIYSDDLHDFFHYDTLIKEENTKSPLVICCFIAGHSQSYTIRRLASHFFKNGHNIYVILQRSTIEGPIDPQQKKFRMGYSCDDLDALLGIIPAEKCIVAGYSLGTFQATQALFCKSPNSYKIQQLILGFTEFDVMYQKNMFKFLQRKLGADMIKSVKKSEAYMKAHGITENELQEVYNKGTIYGYDSIVHTKMFGFQDADEYYRNGDISSRIGQIKVPTVFISTKDDAIAGPYIPREEIRSNKEFVSLLLINKGNHLGTVLEDGRDIVSMLALEFINMNSQ